MDVQDDDDDDDDIGSPISMSHAKVYAFRNRLAELDLSEKSRPAASFVINIPMKVQRKLGTFKKQGLKCGQTRMVLLEFTGYQKERVISDADTSIRF